MKETELKPCPFCGGEVEECMILHHKEKSDPYFAFNHWCEKDAEGELTIFISVYGKTREELIERWNRRADNEQRKD